MKQLYKRIKFNAYKEKLIEVCDTILRKYAQDGYIITVRTLYYQLVKENIIPNTEKDYKALTVLINDARVAGFIDWDVLTDMGRNWIDRSHWTDGKQFLESCAPQFHANMWEDQEQRVFVIVEKEALTGVLSRTCREFDVPLLAAKGYPSVSVVREWVKKTLIPVARNGQGIVLLHLGDHDPSGRDMSRDLVERVYLFGENRVHLDFHRIALNMDQIEEVDPPENPAKITDPRAGAYIREFGDSSWELDALTPEYLNNLLTTNIEKFIDFDVWRARMDFIDNTKLGLEQNARTFGSEL